MATTINYETLPPSGPNTEANTVTTQGAHQQLTQPLPVSVALQGGIQQPVTLAPVFTQGTPVNMNTTPVMTQEPNQNINTTPILVNNLQGSNPQETERTTHEQVFPVRTFKIFGGVQIGLGVLLAIMSLIGTILDGINMNKTKNCFYWDMYYSSYEHQYHLCAYSNNYDILFAFDITCLILSGWVSLQCTIVNACTCTIFCI